MNKRFTAAIAAGLVMIFATASAAQVDTMSVIETSRVSVSSSGKETNSVMGAPNAMSVITPFKAQQRSISSIKGLSMVVPNLFIPDYGSRMSTPVYLRGVGARSSGQSVGMYVDNIPYMDKSTFDFDFMDISSIEVLRGPQGTLYGRNAMGGIINVNTVSPFDYQGTRIMFGAGSYGTMQAKASTYQKFSDKVALSLGAYWDKQDGYFRNEGQMGQKADQGWSIGGRLKLEYRVTDRLTAYVASSYDYADQNAFPYGFYNKETKEVENVNYNDQGSYLRNMSNNSVRFEYRAEKFLLTSNTGYQWMNDNMWMDQDFSTSSIFTINQRQLQNNINQEIALRSTTSGNYQWSVGFFGFYNAMKTGSQVTFKEDGIRNVIQANLPPFIKITDKEIPNPGDFFTPSYGLALFHQSTFNNILTPGLSATVGVRLDYEHQYIDYNTSMAMHGTAQAPGMPRPMPFTMDSTMIGAEQQSFLRALPKISVKYECAPGIMTYATVSRGYKAGGYNFQMFSEVLQRAMNPMNKDKTPIKDMISYKPEMAWNYEVGSRATLLGGRLTTDLAVFYMDVKNQQLTKFVDGGSGRILTNAGRGSSVGVEVALSAQPITDLQFDAAYGYTHSTFRDYDAGVDKQGNSLDYSGNHVPYTPQHTFSVGANYTFRFKGWLESMTIGANFNGAGKIYWDEANTISQPFYGLLDAKVTLRSSLMRLELWANNITSTNYGAFYFESFGNSFIQKGKPFTCGVRVMVTL